jgi:hypothetical protein
MQAIKDLINRFRISFILLLTAGLIACFYQAATKPEYATEGFVLGFLLIMGVVVLCNGDPRDIELRERIAEHHAFEDRKVMKGIRDRAERRMARELLESQGYTVVAPDPAPEEQERGILA